MPSTRYQREAEAIATAVPVREPQQTRQRRLGAGGLLAIGIWLYLIWLPVSNNWRLYSLIATLGLLSVLRCIGGGRSVAPPILALVVLQYIFALFGVTVGLVNRDPGISTQAILYLFVPAVYWCCVAAIDAAMLQRLLKVGCWATAALGSTIVIFALQSRGQVPHVIPGIILRQEQTFALAGRLRFIGLQSLGILGPLYTASLVLPYDSRWLPKVRIRTYAVAVTFVACALSGRQALIVVDIASPFIALIVSRAFRADRRHISTAGRHRIRRAASLAPVWAATVIVFIGLSTATGAVSTRPVTEAFSSVGHLIARRGPSVPEAGNNLVLDPRLASSLSNVDILREEGGRLLTEWRHKPIQGAGFGASIDGYARDPAKPWNFEAQYPLLLFQTGVVGVVILMLAARRGWMALRSAARLSPDLAFALTITTTAAMCLLVTNAVDPYLQAGGQSWGLYLPFAAANVAFAMARSNSRYQLSD